MAAERGQQRSLVFARGGQEKGKGFVFPVWAMHRSKRSRPGAMIYPLGSSDGAGRPLKDAFIAAIRYA